MKKKLKIKKIAESVGVHWATVYRWMSGSTAIKPDDALALEAATGVKAEAWLLPEKYNNPYLLAKRKKSPQIPQ